jgi:pimeloyl-ACP methyl ester carboxylesterase
MPTNPSSLARVNGIELSYQVAGEGEPLILLHGGFGSVEMFGPNVELLAARRQVIGVDLQSHGRSPAVAILPGVTHYDINVVPALSAAVIPFLDGA